VAQLDSTICIIRLSHLIALTNPREKMLQNESNQPRMDMYNNRENSSVSKVRDSQDLAKETYATRRNVAIPTSELFKFVSRSWYRRRRRVRVRKNVL
jgi:hypothetical protein